MTLPLLNNGASVVFLVSGSEKAKIVKAIFEGPETFPAQAIKPTNGQLLWMLDKRRRSLILEEIYAKAQRRKVKEKHLTCDFAP